MSIHWSRWRAAAAGAAGVACLTLAVGACSSNGGPASSSAAAASAAAAPAASSAAASSSAPAFTGTAKTIAGNWVKFFSPSTSVTDKASLLQNGATFSSVLSAQSSSAQSQATSVKVDAVTSITSTTASVTWDLLISGATMLPNQKGTAVFEDGTWKVSKSSFCDLLSLQPPAPAASSS